MGFSRQEYWSGVPLPFPICLPTERKSTTCALAYAVFSLSFSSQEYWSFCFLCSLLHKGFHCIASSGFYFKSYTEITLFNIAYNFSVVKSYAHSLHLTKILSSFSLSSFLLISFQTLLFFFGGGLRERGRFPPAFLISHWHLLSSIFC